MLRAWLSKLWPFLLIGLLVGFVSWENIIPGTYLTGWDNLHPEFDFKTNFVDRGIKGVWQYYQGLGVPSGNAHVADMPRQLILWLASLVVRQNLIRYGYHLLAWMGGGLGFYWLFLKLLATKELSYRQKQISALVGSIFYLFNLGTVQNFYAPYEAFSHFYLMLPWLIYVFLSYLQDGTKKQLLLLALVNLLAVPMSYIPTIFIIYMLIIGFLSLGELAIHRLKNWKKIVTSLTIIIAVNSFWLLPFTHFVANNTKGVVEAKINRMFTEEAYLRNEKYGDLNHSLVMEGFWFDTTDISNVETVSHDFMMRPWIDFLKNKSVQVVLWILFAVMVVGYLYATLTKKRYGLYFLLLAFVGFFALINSNWPTGSLFVLFREKIPLFGQVLRFPYTKFVFLVILGYSVGISYFVEMVYRSFSKIGIIVGPTIIVLILFVQQPVFDGHFFYDQLRLKVPTEYFDVYSFFQYEDRPRGRIANLPQPTFWGWTTYGWGYRGSGFPWYGIPQPILDRNFDVWSPESEHYYSDLTNAIYSNDDPKLFLNVLNKYGIDYVWIDGWVINPQKPQLLDMSQVKLWLEGSGDFRKVFEDGKQAIYKRNMAIVQEGLLRKTDWDVRQAPALLRTIEKENVGKADYVRYGDNIWPVKDLPKDVIDNDRSPFIFLFSEKDVKELEFKPLINARYSLKQLLPNKTVDNRVWWMRDMYIAYKSKAGEQVDICLSKEYGKCFYIARDVNEKGGYRWGKFDVLDTTSPSEIHVNVSGNISLETLKIGYFDQAFESIETSSLSQSDTFDLQVSLFNEVGAKNCYQFGKGFFTRSLQTDEGGQYVRYSAYDASSCESKYISTSDFLIEGGTFAIETRSVSGRPVKICLRHDPPGECLVEEIVTPSSQWHWDVYKIPPVGRKGDLYLEVDNYAVGKELRTNDIRTVELRRSISSSDVDENPQTVGIYTNNQAYREGWIGMSSGNILEHAKVDGWANGWMVPKGVEKIIIFYWPQLLEYLGFIIFGITLVVLVAPKRVKGY